MRLSAVVDAYQTSNGELCPFLSIVEPFWVVHRAALWQVFGNRVVSRNVATTLQFARSDTDVRAPVPLRLVLTESQDTVHLGWFTAYSAATRPSLFKLHNASAPYVIVSHTDAWMSPVFSLLLHIRLPTSAENLTSPYRLTDWHSTVHTNQTSTSENQRWLRQTATSNAYRAKALPTHRRLLKPYLFRTNYTNFTIGEKFRNFTELYNGSDGTEQLWLKLQRALLYGTVHDAFARFCRFYKPR